MKAKIYPKGQIVIPAILRQKYGLEIGESVEILPEEGYLKIKRVKTNNLMNLAGVVKSKKPLPSKKDIHKIVEDSAVKRNLKE